MKKKKWLYGFLALAVLLGLDQWTKWLAVTNLKGKAPFVIIKDVFEFYYFENRGAAFGILQNQRIFLVLFTAIILAVIFWFFYRIPEKKRYFPIHCLCVLVTAGALGNFIDRLLNGYVVDFIYFKLINFPIFNVADCYVTITFLFVLLFLFIYKEEELDELWHLGKKKKGA